MLSLRNINPMVRAVGTMGAVAALVGGVTFASLTSNVVALDDNTLTSATATLEIGLLHENNCADSDSISKPGMNFTLTPGVASEDFNFCLRNTGDVALAITTAIPQVVFVGSPISPADVTLTMTCDNEGSSNGQLNQYTGGTPLGTINAGESTDCVANVTLSGSVTASNSTVNPFDIQFVGTQTTPVEEE